MYPQSEKMAARKPCGCKEGKAEVIAVGNRPETRGIQKSIDQAAYAEVMTTGLMIVGFLACVWIAGLFVKEDKKDEKQPEESGGDECEQGRGESEGGIGFLSGGVSDVVP